MRDVQQDQQDLQAQLNRLGVTGPAAQWLMAKRQAMASTTADPAVASVSHAAVRRPRPVRAWLLWLFSSPLILATLSALVAGRLDGFIADAAAWGLVALAALLTRRASLQPAAEAEQRRFSQLGQRWQFPLRNQAAVSLAAGTCIAAVYGVGHPLGVGLGFAAVAVLAYHLIYRLEPLRVGRPLTAQDKESRAVIEALAEAEDRLITIERAAAAIGNRELSQRLARIAELGRGILAQIAERPSDLRRARRFLTVFLEGAEQVSDGYARTHRHADSAELEQSFRTVLITIEEQFQRQRERLREADVLDLDVQIEVLKKQLDQEGIG
ncbi:MAG: 5-bromo-4-chloroindolyl phosphate hydrolysis family protein [Lamprobacter sp.]|uniref:5-bromo-4-chloroindolyl phosphate hydrolysis family protein n=1 Tax=Lamprobacter sp. TaxID=3100796 RepID=UPI002B25A08D|nr:5-bromo-4-chloroindolyl phosphate hydrolysis family protein [Lamprobacter sp.]MEA3640099.1 5-bromo-4-chloroindolyl phosphate hydrolysis family protein [Lamprobacter sp.]